MGSGRTVNLMEGIQSLYVSPICPDSTLSEQTESRGGLSTADCTRVAKSVWFPQLLGYLVDFPILLPLGQSIITDPAGPLVLEGHLPLAAWPVPGDVQKGFQMELSRSLVSLGESQHSHPTQVHGSCGIAGVLEMMPIPFQHLSAVF